MKQETVFSKLKVVELASVLAGPSVGMFFSELGAEVIKIENKESQGDVTRSWKLASEDPNHPYSAYYGSVNWGKESLFFNLKDEQDFLKVCEEIKACDVLICNFKPGDAAKFNLSFSDVIQLNPKIILGEISGFGSESKRLAYDIVLQAETGFLSMNGNSSSDLAKLPVAIIDLFAAHQLKEGLLIALLQQSSTQKPYHIEVSLFDAGLAALANQGSNWLMAQSIAKPLGMLHPNIAPYGEKYACSDGKEIVLAVGSNRQFADLCKVLGLNNMAKDPRFKSNQVRLKHRMEMDKILSESFRAKTRASLLESFHEHQVPAGAVRNMKEVFELPEAQKQIISEDKEGQSLKTIRGNAFRISSH